MKIDPYKHKERYLNWKEKVKNGIPDISKINSELILQYASDMENGLNVSLTSPKGARSYIRLNTLRQRMVFLVKLFKEHYNLDDITKITEEQLCFFFTKMRKGEIRRQDGKKYASVSDFVKIFKAFWHWWQIVNRKKGMEIKDLTTDLDTSKEKPKWVYLTEKQIKKLCDNAMYNYRVFIMFLYDTGIRSPTELVNIKVSDLYGNCKELQIRDEISKTFGRRIKLMICSDLLKDYIKSKGLEGDDYLFKIDPSNVNRYLKNLGKRVLGDVSSPAGQKYSELTMYDFRHCSCCYWLPRYKSESALKYRFGWKKSDKIHYYSELLGMKDTISEEDLLIDITKTDIEKKLEKSEREKEIMKERINHIEENMGKILLVIKKMYEQVT